MKRKVIVNPDALADLREAAVWYEGNRRGSGNVSLGHSGRLPPHLLGEPRFTPRYTVTPDESG